MRPSSPTRTMSYILAPVMPVATTTGPVIFGIVPAIIYPRLSVMSNPMARRMSLARYARWSSPIASFSLIGSEMTSGR